MLSREDEVNLVNNLEESLPCPKPTPVSILTRLLLVLVLLENFTSLALDFDVSLKLNV